MYKFQGTMDIVGSVGGRTLKLKHVVASNVEITEFGIVKFCTNQRVRISDKEKLLLLRTAARLRSSEKLLLLDFSFLRVLLDQRQSR